MRWKNCFLSWTGRRAAGVRRQTTAASLSATTTSHAFPSAYARCTTSCARRSRTRSTREETTLKAPSSFPFNRLTSRARGFQGARIFRISWSAASSAIGTTRSAARRSSVRRTFSRRSASLSFASAIFARAGLKGRSRARRVRFGADSSRSRVFPCRRKRTRAAVSASVRRSSIAARSFARRSSPRWTKTAWNRIRASRSSSPTGTRRIAGRRARSTTATRTRRRFWTSSRSIPPFGVARAARTSSSWGSCPSRAWNRR